MTNCTREPLCSTTARPGFAIDVCDSVGISRAVFDESKRLIHHQTGLAAANMLMAATHTHSASNARGNRGIVPEPLDEYQQFLALRIRDAVMRAINHLEPARIGWGRGHNDRQVFNRRWRMKPGSAQLRNPFGGVDQVRMNPPANHPDLVEPAGPVDHISADYFGMFAEEIKRLLGAGRQDPPFVGILSNGTSGNINNIDFRPSPDQARRKYEPYEKMRAVAREVPPRSSAPARPWNTPRTYRWPPRKRRSRSAFGRPRETTSAGPSRL